MTDQQSDNLQSGEAKIGRFVFRMTVALAWFAAAVAVYTSAEKFDISYTMKVIIAGFAAVMALVSFVQALGNYGPEDNRPSDKPDDEIKKK